MGGALGENAASVPHRYRSAVTALRATLRKRFPDDVRRRELEELVEIVVRSCEAARAYQARGNDWFKRRRAALNMAREKRDTMRSAARRLAHECRAGNPMLAAAIGPAFEEWRYVVLGNLTPDNLPPVSEVLANVLTGIADRLDRANIEELADPPELHARRRHGNMEFAEDIGRAHLPDVHTMLAFQLEFYMRAFVAVRPFAPSPFDTPTGNALNGKPHRDLAATMKDGKPHRDLIASFVKAAFPKSALVDARAIADRISKLIPRVLWLDDFH